MDKQLRLTAGQIVVESEMTPASKLQLLNFIKEEASDAQIKALLMDGKIVKLDEQAEEIVNDRFDISEISAIKALAYDGLDPFKNFYKFGVQDGFAVSAFIAAAGVAGTFAYKRFLSKSARACKGKSGVDKTRCMQKFKLDAIKEKIKVMQKGISMCTKSKDPGKCKSKLTQKITKEKAKLGE